MSFTVVTVSQKLVENCLGYRRKIRFWKFEIENAIVSSVVK